MNLIAASVANPVKVAVGVLLVTLFGLLALASMPIQLTPEVQVPTISVETIWRGASPQEIEREIIQPLEEQLRSVEGLVKLSSESSDSMGLIELEFAIGTDMSQALVKANTRMQQVRDWPIDADRPVIRTASTSDRPIAWFILGQAAPDGAAIEQAKLAHPALSAELSRVSAARTPDLALYRLRALAAAHPEITDLAPPNIDIESLRRMAEDDIEGRLERVDGVSSADLVGGRVDELQVIIDPQLLAARQLTIDDLRIALVNQNQDTSGGDFWEGKRRYVVRTIGQFRSPEQVAGAIITRRDGRPVYVRDVAKVQLGTKKPDGVVRRFGARNIAIKITREQGANVLETMRQLRAVADDIDRSLLRRQGLSLTLVYDETDYIGSAIGLVKDNIIVGGLLTIATLLIFLRNIRSTLIVALAIPVSVVGTFLALALFGRTLNVISLAGMAFAVGMLVDNAVVVLENIFSRWTAGDDPRTAAIRGTDEVWGAVLASTLTTVAVFLPVLFVREEAGQLFGDIALAISAAVGLSLVVSVLVVPVAAAWLLVGREAHAATQAHPGDIASRFGHAFTEWVIGLDRFLLASPWRQATASLAIVLSSMVATWLLLPKVEYLPEGNRNLVFGILLPPPGYNLDELLRMGDVVEERLLPYWNVDPGTPEAKALDAPVLGDFFFVARGRSVFIGLRAFDPLEAAKLVPLESVAEVREYSSGPEQILHRERQRAITVQVSPPPTMPLEEAQQRIQTMVVDPLIASGSLAGGYTISLGGTADKLRATWKALWFNLVLAGLITYLLMAALFESWFYPAVIIASVPLGSVGGLLGLAAVNVFGAPFGIFQSLDVLTMLGFVILIGTVVNNPILIVDRALQLVRQEGFAADEAILEAVRSRVRPIFMTTLTTVLGLLPLVLFPGAGSELYRGLGAVLLGGLLVSTLVTLVLVPLLLGLCFRAFPVSASK